MLKVLFIVDLTRFFCLAFGDNYVTTNEDTPILLVTKVFDGDFSLGDKVYVDIR